VGTILTTIIKTECNWIAEKAILAIKINKWQQKK